VKEDGSCWNCHLPSTFGWKLNSVYSCSACGKLWAKRIKTTNSGKIYHEWVEIQWPLVSSDTSDRTE
jgi:hypothetical protein